VVVGPDLALVPKCERRGGSPGVSQNV
jgi:hypothetical protein